MDDGSSQNSTWPLPKFYFAISGLYGLDTISFMDISEIISENTPIEYRAGDSKSFYPIKMPGLGKTNTVTLKKGTFAKDDKLFKWFNAIKLNTIKRSTVVIKLLDESGNPVMTWQLNNAFPVKVSSTAFNSTANEVAVESIEIAFETHTVSV